MNMIVEVFKSILWVIFLSLLLLVVPRLSGLIVSLVNYQAIDPDGAYAWISVHHIVMAVIFILIIMFIRLTKPLEFGFGWGNKEIGKKYVKSFTIIFGVGSLVSHFIMILTNTFQQFPYPLTATNIIGQLSFQLLLSGTAEELVFRAFAMTMLALVIKGRVFNGKVSIANIIAAIIFGVAHVGFSFAPFSVSYIPSQVILAIVLGLFYGDCCEKSKSMYYPMMMHGISNVIMVSIAVVATYFMTR